MRASHSISPARIGDIGVQRPQRRDRELERRLDLLRRAAGAQNSGDYASAPITARRSPPVAVKTAASRSTSAGGGSSATNRAASLRRDVARGRGMRRHQIQHLSPSSMPRPAGSRLPRTVFALGVVRVGSEEEIALALDEAAIRAQRAVYRARPHRPPPDAPSAAGRSDRPAGERARHLDHVLLRVAAVDAERVQLQQLARVVLVQTARARWRGAARCGRGARPRRRPRPRMPAHRAGHAASAPCRAPGLRPRTPTDDRTSSGRPRSRSTARCRGRAASPDAAPPREQRRNEPSTSVGSRRARRSSTMQPRLVVGERDVEVVEPEVDQDLLELILGVDRLQQLVGHELADELALRAIAALAIELERRRCALARRPCPCPDGSPGAGGTVPRSISPGAHRLAAQHLVRRERRA